MRPSAVLAGAALLAACSSGPQPVSDWEREHPELLQNPETAASLALPAMPRKEDLIEFYISPNATFRYFVDGKTLAVSYKSREIRYVLVGRSPSGVENVSYEALRCPELHRVYAVGGDDGKWRLRAGGDWQKVERGTSRGWPWVLSRQFFCPHNDPIQSVAEGVNALRLGSHPAVYVEQRPGPAGR